MVRGSEYIDVRHQEDNYHEFDAILTVHRRQYVEIKCQLDATEVFLLRILLLAQHVSGTTMPIIRSSRVLYSGCCLWYFMLWFSSCWSLLCSILQTGHTTLSSTPDQQLENRITKYHRQQPLYNTLELLMMGIVVLETCWASNKICNKNLCCI